MTFMLTRIHVDDYEGWKSMFDSDPAEARAAAIGHRILRSVEDPNELFIQVEFSSAADATAARDRLINFGILDRVEVKAGPTITEMAELTAY